MTSNDKEKRNRDGKGLAGEFESKNKDNRLNKPILEELHTLFAEQYRKQHINYKKFYHVSNEYKKKGERLKNISLFIGLISLFVLGGLISDLLNRDIVEEGLEGFTTDLLTVVFIFSSLAIIVTVFEVKEKWVIKATRYHKYGQVHQNLFTDLEFIIKTKFQDPNTDIDDLKQDYKRIIRRKNQLNQVSPHIPNYLYKDLEIDIDIDPTASIDEFEIVSEVREREEERPDSLLADRFDGLMSSTSDRTDKIKDRIKYN